MLINTRGSLRGLTRLLRSPLFKYQWSVRSLDTPALQDQAQHDSGLLRTPQCQKWAFADPLLDEDPSASKLCDLDCCRQFMGSYEPPTYDTDPEIIAENKGPLQQLRWLLLGRRGGEGVALYKRPWNIQKLHVK